jgi:two-component system OmpR family sensor kinase
VTIRTRLLIGLLALAAIGLMLAGAITYREQKRFLYQRANEQVRTAATAPGLLNPSGSKTSALPIGTYVQVRSYSGDVLIESSNGTGEIPHLPAQNPELGHVFTVDNPRYRVVAQHYRDPRREIEGIIVAAIPLRDVDDSLHRLLFVEIVVALGILVTLAGMTWLMIKLGLRPLEQMQATAGAIAAGDLSQRVEVVDETTEVGKLGIALNEMMTQIESAFDERAASEERLRRFVGDASHELRTPLTSIRGYAELFRRGAADRPEDLAKAMRRIEEEADRMGVLVDDLLLLARLDQGRPLEQDRIDLTRLARDGVDDLHTVAPDRPVDFSAPGAVYVTGDDPRLRQVIANLLTNANRHTPPATPVHVRVSTEDAHALLDVIDEGPGMEEAEAKRVFERFWRSDPARTRTSGGAGLGLSIVAAIAEAHGGKAEVFTKPGEGATFRITLPLYVEAATPDAPATPAPVPNIPIAELEDSAATD